MGSKNRPSLEFITFDDFCNEMTAAKTVHTTDSNLYKTAVDINSLERVRTYNNIVTDISRSPCGSWIVSKKMAGPWSL